MLSLGEPPPPGFFSEVFILKDFKSNDFGSAHSKGVTCHFFASAHSTGFRSELAFAEECFEPPTGTVCSRLASLAGRLMGIPQGLGRSRVNARNRTEPAGKKQERSDGGRGTRSEGEITSYVTASATSSSRK